MGVLVVKLLFYSFLFVGGIVSIAMDKEGLDEYVQLNPSISDLDDLIGSAIATGFIPQETLDRCNITSSLLDTGDLQIVLESNQTNEQYCNHAAEELAINIDDPTVNQIAVTPQVRKVILCTFSSKDDFRKTNEILINVEYTYSTTSCV